MYKMGFIGLGVMGWPMAGHLKKNGHDVTVYNRSSQKAESWLKKFKGKIVSTPKEASLGADFVFTCVGNDDDVLSVVDGKDGILSGIKKGSILVDHTTASSDLAINLNKKTSLLGVNFIDAPVSGGQAGAENGTLSIMCGGEKKIFDRVLPILESYGKNIALIGDVGSGQLSKMVNQICIAGLIQGLSEGINFGLKSNLDMKKVLDVISGGAAGSWQMNNRGVTMTKGEFNFGFAVDWMRKDLSICLKQSQKIGAKLPITSIIDEYYANIQKKGGGRWDTSSLISLLLKN